MTWKKNFLTLRTLWSQEIKHIKTFIVIFVAEKHAIVNNKSPSSSKKRYVRIKVWEGGDLELQVKGEKGKT